MYVPDHLSSIARDEHQRRIEQAAHERMVRRCQGPEHDSAHKRLVARLLHAIAGGIRRHQHRPAIDTAPAGRSPRFRGADTIGR